MQNYTDQILQILEPYQSKHIVSIGAHIHHVDVFSSKSFYTPNIALVQVIVPSVTPIYNNNPGYGSLSINEQTQKIESFIFRFMQLEDYHRFKVVNFEEYEPGRGRFNLNDAQSVRSY